MDNLNINTSVTSTSNDLKPSDITPSAAYGTLSPINRDLFEKRAQSKEGYSELKEELNTLKKQQGLMGIIWDGFKNLTKIGAGSNKAKNAIEDYKSGKISLDEAKGEVEKYKSGQKQCVDMISDIVSGIASFGAFALSTGVGIAAAPLTGGASLGLVFAGFGIAGVSGALIKTALKGLDCAVGHRKYDSLGYDLATGGINGMFAPITAGIGGAAGKAVAGRFGVQALREGGEVAIKSGLQNTLKGSLTKTLLTTNVAYIGGSSAARAAAIGADLAVNGAITGAVDSTVRYAASSKEEKAQKDLGKEVLSGTIGGLILSPVIGGGMRLLGNAAGKVTGKLEKKVKTNYNKAAKAAANTPVVESPDKEVMQRISEIIERTRSLPNELQLSGDELIDEITRNLDGASDDFAKAIQKGLDLNAEIQGLSAENRALVNEILEELAQGKDPASKIAQLSQKGISLSEMLDKKMAEIGINVEDGLQKAAKGLQIYDEHSAQANEMAHGAVEKIAHIAADVADAAEKIPETKAFQQLGELPQRAKKLYYDIMPEAKRLDVLYHTAYAKIRSGDTAGGLKDLARYYTDADLFNRNLEQQLTSIQSSAQRSGMDDSTRVVANRLLKLKASKEFQSMTREQQIQAIAENSNILLAKFAQTFSSDKSIPKEIQNLFKQFTSNCTSSRTPAQAQALADEMYGAGKYTIQKKLKAGTIGEAYIAKTQDGKEVVIKMLKDNVTPERFKQDRELFTRYINEFITDEADKQYKLGLINGMFDAWDSELNFALEAQNGAGLAQGAKRFSVAKTFEVGSKNGQNISLVMEKADGVALDKLLPMVELYRKNPSEYFSKYKDTIKEFPALNNPEEWIEKLGTIYQRAQNEQIMFIGKEGTRTIHADPHTGNVFVGFDGNNPKIIYIDTGNTIARTNAETLSDICLSLNTMIGNSEGIARAMFEGATIPQGANREELIKKAASLMDERLFKAGVNLKDTSYTQRVINSVLQDLSVIPDSNNSNLLKAALQRIETSRAINDACGTTSNRIVDVKDLLNGIWKSFKKHPKETLKAIKPIIKWAKENDDQAMITFFQMMIKNPQAAG